MSDNIDDIMNGIDEYIDRHREEKSSVKGLHKTIVLKDGEYITVYTKEKPCQQK